jgi:ABC-2 type transport system ATP-binding protein
VEPLLTVQAVRKSYDGLRAVDGLSFHVAPGEIFGLLGPNGSGKTTTIRMIVDIIKPDEGAIALFGGAMTPASAARLGYLPEDRGLYQRLRVGEVLVFLGMLKGLERHVARRRAEMYLDRVELLGSIRQRMRELSKGMQQKVQIVAAVMHEPDFLIMDEPFSGLDPVNRVLIIELIHELARRGAAVIFSTHQMDQVEALCSRVLLINQGREALSGGVAQIRRDHADDSVLIRADVDWAGRPEVESAADEGQLKRIRLRPGTSPEEFVGRLAAAGVRIEHFERRLPSLDEIYIQTMRAAR